MYRLILLLLLLRVLFASMAFATSTTAASTLVRSNKLTRLRLSGQNVWAVQLLGTTGQIQAAIARRCPQMAALSIADDGEYYRFTFFGRASCAELIDQIRPISASLKQQNPIGIINIKEIK